MPARPKNFPYWFIGVLAVLVTSQVFRLFQTDAVYWTLCDYGGRIGALALLWFVPTARAIAYQRQPLRTTWWETALWIIGLIVLFDTLCQWMRHAVDTAIPGTKLGGYPILEGWFYLFDLTFGLMLVAIQEEIVFRRCAREVFGAYRGQGAVMILLSALLFSAYHWTTGLGNMVAVFIFGAYAMLFLRRTGALWPLIVAHFLNDFVQFSGIF